MARFHISVKPYRSEKRPNAKWVLNVWHPTGKRERRFFETKEAAIAEQSVKQVEVENLGLRALEISSRLRFEALDAQERLAPYGVTITQVVDDYIRRRGSPKTTVREVADIYLKSRIQHGRSKKHLDSLRRLFERFTGVEKIDLSKSRSNCSRPSAGRVVCLGRLGFKRSFHSIMFAWRY